MDTRTRGSPDCISRIAQSMSMSKRTDARQPNILNAEAMITTEEYIFVFSELVAGGDLFSFVHRSKLSGIGRDQDAEQQIAWIVYQLSHALCHLHELGILHRDIKLENVLVLDVMPYSRVLLADFGMAQRQYVDVSTDKQVDEHVGIRGRFNTYVGTLAYQAPELLACRWSTKEGTDSKEIQDRSYGREIDMWQVLPSVS